jgi:hypothetical protein
VLAYLSRYTHRVAISNSRADNVAKARKLLAMTGPVVEPQPESTNSDDPGDQACPCCGGCMLVIDVFA